MMSSQDPAIFSGATRYYFLPAELLLCSSVSLSISALSSGTRTLLRTVIPYPYQSSSFVLIHMAFTKARQKSHV
ncbi:hypothetical protein BDV33DRAFT_89478 [Aspergillus novoparasiticus]|uniref:Uncharacterized protein n=1 Tax=Aspergillus novoparasiticus TaxID=986946 RepID=A0A5N6ET89_9EURO|nr:hypothetical protein BDV33DRAFT_89478 [Aspergillus novoparasiticus]